AQGDSKAYDMWWVVMTTIVMGVGIGVLAQPQLIVRYMTVKSQQSLNRAVAAGGFFILVVIGVTYTVGPLSNVYFRHHESLACTIVDEKVLLYPDPAAGGALAPLPAGAAAEERAKAKEFVSYTLWGGDGTVKYALKTPAMRIRLGGAGEPDRIEPGLISIARTVKPGAPLSGNRDSVMPEYVTSAMPKWFGALFMLTLLAAGMSTVSSQLHTMGTAIGRDVYERLTGGAARRSMLINRVGVLVGIVAALALGRVAKGNVIAIATAVFFGICASAFLPAYLGGLFWKRMTRAGAVASVAAGLGVSLLWLVFVNERVAKAVGICASVFGRATLLPEGWSRTWVVMDPLLVSLPVSVLVAVGVSLATRPMAKEYVAYCFGGPRPGTGAGA
ncbi:MAG TPA: sodium:solute symporter family protein, partial [Candidatus Brocadiia bacterium]|nr:sodium:solute symporter family protein [Candidatus Brocadiia bacterium]